MIRYNLMLILALIFACTPSVTHNEDVTLNKVYNKQSFHNENNPISKYRYVLIQHTSNSQEPQSQITLSRSDNIRSGNFDDIITGASLKAGLTIIDSIGIAKLDSSFLPKVVCVQWGISGRTARDDDGAFSQEVTVMFFDYIDRTLVYRGIGEYLGQSEIDDLKGALNAALEGLVTP